MKFTELDLKRSVKTTREDPIEAFFNPVLTIAKTYDVAVGYFRSGWFRDAAFGIAKFAENGGVARFVISPELTDDDYRALKESDKTNLGDDCLSSIITRSFSSLFDSLSNEPRRALAWLIADGIVQFRVGIPINELSGILHAKIGHLTDGQGNQLSFEGSYNLTHGAQTNWEKISIFCDWKSDSDSDRVQDAKEDFEDMWYERDKNLQIYRPSDLNLEPFISFAKQSKRPYHKPSNNKFKIPAKFLTDGKLRPYQELAISEWFQNNGQGIFNMATGSGKTATALAAATRLANHSEANGTQLVFIVVVPYLHLAEQWIEEVAEFGFRPIRCFDNSKIWMKQVQAMIRDLNTDLIQTSMLMVVNKTFTGEKFQNQIKQIPGNKCIIADEMHNLGSSQGLTCLPDRARFRLGLSATPVRHRDDLGTEGLESYFGKQVIEFTLKEAIENDYLCKYRYYPIAVPLTDREMDEYFEITKEISKAYRIDQSDGMAPNERMKKLLIKRARLVAGAENKVTKLVEMVSEDPTKKFNLIYCGDTNDGNERHVEQVKRRLGRDVGMTVHTFTADEPRQLRRELLQRFSSGDLQALVAIRCLDEGVDVPRTETAYILASSTNPRQFIQRRGRVLRKAKGKTFAAIYDFLAVPDIEKMRLDDPAVYQVERSLVRRELERVDEFAQLAINSGDTLTVLRDIKQKLNLMDM
tara:strand:+ start:14976 stop:17063 length:2088 start_codon:yes stop_codon:yes gene_type:complete